MMRYYSLRMNLEDVIKDKDTEQVILENIRRCSKIVGREFKIILWHENLTKKQCEDFVKRNGKLLFEVNTQITKTFGHTWYLIKSKNEKSSGRYSFDGNILEGIAGYLEIINHIKKRDGNQ
tara:strand:+ start:267 stop:629 length:363 start_codon:yes stop_codon:yes gene_type:complete